MHNEAEGRVHCSSGRLRPLHCRMPADRQPRRSACAGSACVLSLSCACAQDCVKCACVLVYYAHAQNVFHITSDVQTRTDHITFILAGGHVRASAGALAVHTALIPCACLSGHKLLSHHATNRDQVCFCRQVSTR